MLFSLGYDCGEDRACCRPEIGQYPNDQPAKASMLQIHKTEFPALLVRRGFHDCRRRTAAGQGWERFGIDGQKPTYPMTFPRRPFRTNVSIGDYTAKWIASW
jgi:hypothetical protein